MDPREKQARAGLYDEIFNYARGKGGEGLRAKYAPPEPTPPPMVSAPDDGLDADSLARLAAMTEDVGPESLPSAQGAASMGALQAQGPQNDALAQQTLDENTRALAGLK